LLSKNFNNIENNIFSAKDAQVLQYFLFFLQVVVGGFIFLFLFFLNNIAEKLKTLWGWQGGVFCFFPF
jgi:hypothetical protein